MQMEFYNYCVSQNYENYTKEDHSTWAELSRRHRQLPQDTIAHEYLAGFRSLNLEETKIINIEELSSRMVSICGWSLMSVNGLIPAKDFFSMLVSKVYPITNTIRTRSEIDFSEQPDIFHDVCGHLPLLTNENFSKFLTAYGEIALRHAKDEKAVESLARLYWYTYEMGLIRDRNLFRSYGGAIITSAQEKENVMKKGIPIFPFDLDHIFNTPYNPYKLQNEYFVIESFNELFRSVSDLEGKLQQQFSVS
jgi:monomeric phenylalanine-4-hydroxylase